MIVGAADQFDAAAIFNAFTKEATMTKKAILVVKKSVKKESPVKKDDIKVAYRKGPKLIEKPIMLHPGVEKEDIEKWIKKQRTKYRLNQLSKEQIEKLESLPNWTWKNRERFNSYVKSIYDFFYENGHIRIPCAYRDEGKNITHWVSMIKKRYRDNKLDDYEIETLEAIPEWTWETKRRSKAIVPFDDMLMMAKAYLK